MAHEEPLVWGEYQPPVNFVDQLVSQELYNIDLILDSFSCLCIQIVCLTITSEPHVKVELRRFSA